MKRSFPYTEPTIWALRKNVRGTKQNNDPAALYEHIYGYDPIKVMRGDEEKTTRENVRKGSAENPSLNIINPQTNFLVREIVSDDPSNA